MVFWPSFHRPRFAAERAYVDELCGAGGNEPPHRFHPLPRLAGARPEALMAGAYEVEQTFEADVPDWLLYD